MRRLGVLFTLVTSFVLAWAGQVLAADYPPSKPPAGGGGSAGGIAPGGGSELPFTGTNISLGLIILVGLVVLGTLLLIAGRRRRVAASKSS